MEQASIKKCVDGAASLAPAAINGQREESRREALITMVQSTDLLNGDRCAARPRDFIAPSLRAS